MPTIASLVITHVSYIASSSEKMHGSNDKRRDKKPRMTPMVANKEALVGHRFA
jgi:hypothetical protein